MDRLLPDPHQNLVNLRLLGLVVVLGSLLMGWSIYQHGLDPASIYLFAGMLLAAVITIANADELLNGSGWKGALVFALVTVAWFPAFYVLFGVLLNEKHTQLHGESNR